MIIDTRITKANKEDKRATQMGIIFQHSVCGTTESRVTDGTTKYWADGIVGTTLVDAKFTKDSNRSPFTPNGFNSMPSFIAQSIVTSITKEFTKVASIVNDPNTTWDSFSVITNTPDTVDFFTSQCRQVGFSDSQFTVTVQ